MYQKDDVVMIVHPDYPEDNGLARVTSNPSVPTILTLERYSDKSRCLAHSDYVRHATRDEIETLPPNPLFSESEH